MMLELSLRKLHISDSLILMMEDSATRSVGERLLSVAFVHLYDYSGPRFLPSLHFELGLQGMSFLEDWVSTDLDRRTFKLRENVSVNKCKEQMLNVMMLDGYYEPGETCWGMTPDSDRAFGPALLKFGLAVHWRGMCWEVCLGLDMNRGLLFVSENRLLRINDRSDPTSGLGVQQ